MAVSKKNSSPVQLRLKFLDRYQGQYYAECGQYPINVVRGTQKTTGRDRYPVRSAYTDDDDDPLPVVLQNVENGYSVCVTKGQKLCNSANIGCIEASPELCMSLDIPIGEMREVKLIHNPRISTAEEVKMSYVSHYSPRYNRWMVGDSSENREALTPTDPVQGRQQKYLDWCTQSGFNEEQQYPSSMWWESFIKGDMNALAADIILGANLSSGNYLSFNLKGVRLRLKVEQISGVSENETCNNKKVISSGNNTQGNCIGNPGDVAGNHSDSSLDNTGNVAGTNADNSYFSIYHVVHTTKVILTIGQKYGESTEDIPKRDESELGGLTLVLEKLNRTVIGPLVDKAKYKPLGIHPPTGVLLHGPPGCGKTMIAKSMRQNFHKMFGIPKEVAVKLKFVQSSDLLSSFVGRTEENISAMFAECAALALEGPCICFIDEVDILCRKRTNTSEHNNRYVTTFLNNMDGLGNHKNKQSVDKGYVIIGTTNDVDSMDPALRRPGRFDLEIEVGVPTSEERLTILTSMLKHIQHNIDAKQLRDINNRCQAFVGADLRLLVTNASWARVDKINEMTNPEESGSPTDPECASQQICLTVEDFETALTITRPSALRDLHLEVPNVRWEDIGGYEDAKKILKECVEYPITYAEAYEYLNLRTPTGVLLYGPPGCSKTLMAKAVATESHMNFISVKGPEIFSMWYGESEKAIRQIFRRARTNAPCIIFFDEMESISTSRDHDSASGVTRRVVSQLLTEMDGITSLKQVMVIGATNRPDLMDAALLRPGRLDRMVYVPLPDKEARKHIFCIYLKRLPTDGFDIDTVAEELAEKTEGYSGAEIALVCKESAMRALRETIGKNISRKTNNKGESTMLPVKPDADHTIVHKTDVYSPDVANVDRLKNDIDTLHTDFDRLSIASMVPVSLRHVHDALSFVKPRTKPETIRFYQNYKNTNAS
ncbi:AAA family CDC48 subfamily protein [Babesia ovis]|uniref:AAA family CDC48 subfamily protein n=1 Tax=Babesia ovis TaxID=5869 RepID=A0A9W5TE97_BABOV|nr:AAA family CDC48 subfamily protein [Babesia ovis]